MRTVGLFVLAILTLPIFVHADALININTAVATTLEDLPGVGPSTAASIIANRPYASIEDISRADGIGALGSSSYEKIKGFITVGDTGTVVATTGQTASSTVTTVTIAEEDTTYVPPPTELTVDAGSNSRDAVMNVPLLFSARVTVNGGAEDLSAQISWGFGDGSSATASVVRKTYEYAGTYLVVVNAFDGSATGRDEIVVTVHPARVSILEVPATGILITNDADERLDLSGWVLTADKKSFHIPSGTILLPKMNVLLSSVITSLPTAPHVTLSYPNGAIAARYTEPSQSSVVVPPALSADRQPSLPQTSFNTVQKVEPIISTRTNVQKNEDEVSAPATPTEPVAAAGATLPTLFKSPWTFGFIGAVILAGAAFIFI